MNDAAATTVVRDFNVHRDEHVKLLRTQAARALVMAGWYPEASAGRTCLEASAATCAAEAVALEQLSAPEVP